MSMEIEVIALLLDDPDDDASVDAIDFESTTCLVRRPDGGIGLERAHSQEELERAAENTGVFARGAPILDPDTGEIIGYELEEIGIPRAAAG